MLFLTLSGPLLFQIGSTEWVEENIMNLGSRAVAYLNVDCAVQGPGLFVSTTPQLDDLLIDITKKVRELCNILANEVSEIYI